LDSLLEAGILALKLPVYGLFLLLDFEELIYFSYYISSSLARSCYYLLTISIVVPGFPILEEFPSRIAASRLDSASTVPLVLLPGGASAREDILVV